MKKKLMNFVILSLLALGLNTVSADAQIRRPAATNQQIQSLLNRIETKTDTFKSSIDAAMDRTMLNSTAAEDRINDFIADFERATDSLTTSFNARRDVTNEVNEVLERAAFINTFMTRNRMNVRTQSQWTSLRTDLDTLSSYYRVSWNWNQQIPGGNSPSLPAYTVSDIQLRNLLTRIENKTDVFKRQLTAALNRSRIDNTNREDNINEFVTEFESATDTLKRRFDSRQSVGADATEVLTRAQRIDRFMANNRLTNAPQTQWRNLKTDLDTLASYYRVSWNWNQNFPGGPIGGNTGIGSNLTGTYRLNTSLSDNVSSVLDRSLNVYTTAQRDNVRRNLERRLASPEMIAIDMNGRTVTMASSNAPQVTFEADGTARTETNPRGRVITTTATANRNNLEISYVGERSNDFNVTFAADRNGQLRVTRRIYLENRNEQVTVSSVYDKVANVAQWSTVNTGGNLNADTGTGNINDFYIPNGTRVTAVLNNIVDTKVSQVGDRFTMEVTSPNQYRGAVIEGRIGEVGTSGRLTGRANVSMEFDTIRLANGQSYRFAGIIDSVRTADGDNISVNNEGTVRDSSQTTRTATRAGIGAVLGAIIGAVAGGGSGAAIGAGVGAGAGAGSVLVTGRDSIRLSQGTEFTITSTGPNNVGINR